AACCTSSLRGGGKLDHVSACGKACAAWCGEAGSSWPCAGTRTAQLPVKTLPSLPRFRGVLIARRRWARKQKVGASAVSDGSVLGENRPHWQCASARNCPNFHRFSNLAATPNRLNGGLSF